jgi:acid phosphatase family membrane protein YuiD
MGASRAEILACPPLGPVGLDGRLPRRIAALACTPSGLGPSSTVEGAAAVDVAYVVAPFTGWFIAGSLKFTINCLRSGRLVWDQIGLGGLPSNHTAVVSSTAVLIGLREGVNTALFAIAMTLAIIVIFDALNLRREVGAHAAALNVLLRGGATRPPFREHVGHRRVEVLMGFLVGLGCAVSLHAIFR